MKVTVIKDKESVIYNGKVYSKGEFFDVDDTIGKSLMERGYVALSASESTIENTPSLSDEGNAETDSSETSLEDMSYTELKKLAASKGINANGKKEELIARIVAAEQEAENENEAPGELPNTNMPD